METLALEVTRALQFSFTSTSYSQVDQVVLTGGCALLSGLDELVAKRAGVTTIVGNPFASMTMSDRIRPRQLAADAPLLLIAGGGVILLPNIPLVKISIMSQVVNGIVLPFVLIFMLLLVNKSELMGKHVNGTWFNAIAWATAIIMIVLTVVWVASGGGTG